MAMNARLLRPLARSGDSDVRAYIAAVEQADTQPLEQGIKDAYRDFIVGCKADGIWSAIKSSCILAGARTLAGALTPLVGSAPTNNNFVSGDYDRKTGLKGNTSNKGLNTNRAGNADGQNDKHGAVYVSEATSAAAGSFRCYFGITGGGNDHVIFRAGADSANLTSRMHSTSADTISSVGSATGLIGSSRNTSATYAFRASGSSQTVTRTSAAPAAGNYLIFTITQGSGTLHSDGRIAFYSVGSALDLALLDTRVSALITAIGNAIP
jgi:hypothetical protein